MLNDILLQHRHSLKPKSEPLGEKSLDAANVTLEVKLSVGVGGTHHLGEIDDSDLLLFRYHEIELVVITMDEAMLGEFDDLGDQVVVDFFGVAEPFDLTHRVCLDQIHDNTMAIGIDRHWGREPSFMQCFHEGIFLQTGDSRHVEPIGRPSLQIVSVVYDRSEGSSSQTREFNDNRVTRLVLLDSLLCKV